MSVRERLRAIANRLGLDLVRKESEPREQAEQARTASATGDDGRSSGGER